MTATLALARELIARRSVTPDDAGCQELIIERLQPLGFAVQRINANDVSNLWARHGSAKPLLCLAGHTDVVPAGPLDKWHTDPFAPSERDGKLFGRGAADMKTGVAAFVTAAERFVRQYPDHPGSIALLITSDEEGRAVDGTVKVVDWLKTQGERIDYTIVGGTGAYNVIPGTVEIHFNFRFATASTRESLQARTETILKAHGLDFEIYWTLSGKPFFTPHGVLVDALSKAIQSVCGISPALSTGGGTSDGRFIADICDQIAEFGPNNASIHQLNEHVVTADIQRVHEVYFRALENLLIARG